MHKHTKSLTLSHIIQSINPSAHRVTIMPWYEVTVYDLLKHGVLLMTTSAAAQLSQRLLTPPLCPVQVCVYVCMFVCCVCLCVQVSDGTMSASDASCIKGKQHIPFLFAAHTRTGPQTPALRVVAEPAGDAQRSAH